MAKQSNYQQRVIRDYYRNQDSLMLQRLGELVGDLYLAEGKARATLWKRAAAAMQKLKIPEPEIAHLLKSDNPALLAKVVERLLGKAQG